MITLCRLARQLICPDSTYNLPFQRCHKFRYNKCDHAKISGILKIHVTAEINEPDHQRYCGDHTRNPEIDNGTFPVATKKNKTASTSIPAMIKSALHHSNLFFNDTIKSMHAIHSAAAV